LQTGTQAGLYVGSIALVGFGFDSFIECAAAALFWRLGIEAQGAEVLVAEWGAAMGRFGTASRLAAWTGVARGHDESAGKQGSGKTCKDHPFLRAALTQLAHAATRTKGTDLSALHQRLADRRGRNGLSWRWPT
jgi:transposase